MKITITTREKTALLFSCMPLFVCFIYINNGGSSVTLFIPQNVLKIRDFSQAILETGSQELTNVTLRNEYRENDWRVDEDFVKQKTKRESLNTDTPKGSENNQNISLLSSHLVGMRGPGDSYLPFEDAYVTNTQLIPDDIFREHPEEYKVLDRANPPLKKILFWNEVFGDSSFYFGFGQKPFLLAGCKVNKCLTTTDRNRFTPEEIDAVVFHVRSPDKALPSKRSPHTRYVFWSLESPLHSDTNLTEFQNVYNWTFTYRLDSDFPNPYDTIYRRRSPLLLPKRKNYAEGKTLLAAWFVSNCVTYGGRETFVKALQMWLKVDVFGKCGPFHCDRSIQENICFKMLERDYKFYFSFENSLCKDYLTEKIFDILKLDVVPVVYGLSDYSRQLPPRSYINALDFPSAKDLAKYLLYLNGNDTAYNEYFQWKRYHRFPQTWFRVAKPWCKLCERLHNDHTTKIYDIKEWFEDKSHCIDFNHPAVYDLINGHPPEMSRGIPSRF